MWVGAGTLSKPAINVKNRSAETFRHIRLRPNVIPFPAHTKRKQPAATAAGCLSL